MKRLLISLGLLTGLFASPIYTKFIQIQDEDQYSKELSANPNMIVEYSADWCSICNGIKKPFEEIANEPEFQQLTFAQVDVDKMDGLSKQNGIVGVPTFIYVENGDKKVEEIGVQNMPAFKDHLRQNLRKTFKIAQNDAMPKEMMAQESVMVDVQPAAAPPAAEPNALVRFFNMIFSFIMMIIMKIKEFFMMIFDAIKGFFNK